jgi:hypothetical protein
MYRSRPRADHELDLQESEEERDTRSSNTLRGELEINVPPGARRRCRSIKVGYKTVARLAMGVERGWEEDCIFERNSEHRSANSEGIWLEEGVTK